MVPIIVVFFILKAVGLGPHGRIALEGDGSYLNAADVVDFLQSIDAETDPATRQIHSTLQLLARLHSVRVLLDAASSAPPDPLAPAEFIVPAYDDSEVSDEDSVWNLDGAKAIETVVAQNNINMGIKFVDGLVQKQTFHAEHHVLPLEQPVLRPFLTKFKDHQLSDDFEPDVCLGACYQSAVRVERHSQSVPCIAKALNLLRLIWGPEVKGNLAR